VKRPRIARSIPAPTKFEMNLWSVEGAPTAVAIDGINETAMIMKPIQNIAFPNRFLSDFFFTIGSSFVSFIPVQVTLGQEFV